nr:ribosomal protein S3 [Schizostauron trachyderma]
MGQKINPNILRLNITNNWNYKYIEKKADESKNYDFKNIEIEKFFTDFFKLHGLTIKKIRLYHFNSLFHVYISYYITPKTIYIVNSNHKNKNIQLTLERTKVKKKYLKTRLKIKKNIKKYNNYEILNYKQVKLINKNKKRINFLYKYKKNALINRYKNITAIKNNAFLEKILESLTLFLKKNINISITLKQVNNNLKKKLTNKDQKNIKKNLIKIRRYNKNQFFKEGVSTLFYCISNLNSAKFLSKFIAKELQNLKRHNFFLKFIKTTLTLFFNKTFSKCKGIKIKIKGRFNGAPRARDKFIIIGDGVPALKINSDLDYNEETSFTSNGTFGVKVWINQK